MERNGNISDFSSDSDDKNFQDLLAKAEQGDATAQYNVGDCYRYGKRVQRDSAKAIHWYTKAAEQGNANAQTQLHFLKSTTSVNAGVKKEGKSFISFVVSIVLFICLACAYAFIFGMTAPVSSDDLLAKATEGDAAAQYDLGWRYYFGEEVEQDYEKAVEWFTKAAEQGHTEAQTSLGVRYYFGEGVEQDYGKAVYWFTKATEQGHAEAQTSLGWRYYFGEGVEQDYEKAVEWFTKAAEQGHAHAQYYLSDCYNNGIGVEQDYGKAVEWCMKSAEQSYVPAQTSLASYYEDGIGVEQDEEKAIYWYTKSAEQGDTAAQDRLKDLSSRW